MDYFKYIKLLQDIQRIFWMYPIKERDDYMRIKRVNIQIEEFLKELHAKFNQECAQKLLDK